MTFPPLRCLDHRDIPCVVIASVILERPEGHIISIVYIFSVQPGMMDKIRVAASPLIKPNPLSVRYLVTVPYIAVTLPYDFVLAMKSVF